MAARGHQRGHAKRRQLLTTKALGDGFLEPTDERQKKAVIYDGRMPSSASTVETQSLANITGMDKKKGLLGTGTSR